MMTTIQPASEHVSSASQQRLQSVVPYAPTVVESIRPNTTLDINFGVELNEYDYKPE